VRILEHAYNSRPDSAQRNTNFFNRIALRRVAIIHTGKICVFNSLLFILIFYVIIAAALCLFLGGSMVEHSTVVCYLPMHHAWPTCRYRLPYALNICGREN
jgi:hypothetical protein